MSNTITRTLPYNLTKKQLIIEPGYDGYYKDELRWLLDNATEDECERFMGAASALAEHTQAPFGACLHTAIVWERG